jgi:anti-sigma regulatory factor (Ser/Thr protein kinase)
MAPDDRDVTIRLIIPARPEFLRLARLAAADVGSRAGFTYEEIEDLRIGVDELCHVVMGDHENDTPEGTPAEVVLEFTLGTAVVDVHGQGPAGAKPQSDLSRTIVAAVVDDHEVQQDGSRAQFRLSKRVPSRSP